MKLKILAFIAVVTMSGIGPARAGFITAEELLPLCESQLKWEKLVCINSMGGMAEAIDGLSELGALKSGFICIPNGTAIEQLQEIFVKYAYENIDKLKLGAGVMAMRAFSESFPCGQGA